MIPRFVVTGTDTGIGKTVFSAGLVAALDGVYWKPIQAGLDEETDRETVQRLSGLPAERMLEEAYRLNTPASPHWAAEIDGVTIDPAKLTLPQHHRPLVVEGAGGLLTPLTRSLTYIDVIAHWQAPVVLCARTTLGTINHSLLSIEALRSRGIELRGIAFIGDANSESERIIAAMGRVRQLGRLPHLAALSSDSLKAAFADAIDIDLLLKDAAE